MPNNYQIIDRGAIVPLLTYGSGIAIMSTPGQVVQLGGTSDRDAHFYGAVLLDNNNAIQMKDSGAVAHNVLKMDGSNNVYLANLSGASGNIYFDVTGHEMTVNTAGATLGYTGVFTSRTLTIYGAAPAVVLVNNNNTGFGSTINQLYNLPGSTVGFEILAGASATAHALLSGEYDGSKLYLGPNADVAVAIGTIASIDTSYGLTVYGKGEKIVNTAATEGLYILNDSSAGYGLRVESSKGSASHPLGQFKATSATLGQYCVYIETADITHYALGVVNATTGSPGRAAYFYRSSTATSVGEDVVVIDGAHITRLGIQAGNSYSSEIWLRDSADNNSWLVAHNHAGNGTLPTWLRFIRYVPGTSPYYFDSLRIKFTNDATTGNEYYFSSTLNGGAGQTVNFVIENLPGTSSGSTVRYYNSRIYYDTSSLKYKDDVRVFTDDFAKILNLTPKTWIDKTTGESGVGYIAEEVDFLGMKDLVSYKDKQPDGLHYEKFPVYLLEVIKQLKAEIDVLKQK